MDLNMTNLVLFRDDLPVSSCNNGDALIGEASGFGGHRLQDDGCRLILGLGPTPSFYCNDYGSTGIQHPADTAAMRKAACYADDSYPVTLKLALPVESEEPNTNTTLDLQNFLQITNSGSSPVSLVSDEGSTSAGITCGGYMPSLLLAPRSDTCSITSQQHQWSAGTADGSNYPNADAVTMKRKLQQQQPKKCRFNGCSKGGRGASGLCIAHGGGQRCSKPGCFKGAESRTAFCKSHGGGRRCEQLGCTKSAEGKTDFCIAHGGGRRCGHPECGKAARGKSGLCIRHGGGKRCSREGCTRSAEGQLGLCISHGGGRRCQHPGCSRGAQGSTMYCKAHGGGKRCVFQGCTKGAEGSTPLCKAHGGGKRCLFEGGCPKSVHGGTDYCVAHGGGKRCVVPGCTKSARGRTDCCVRHGGGKRCKSEGCDKSAQGSTDFCKAHGGGKRCAWAPGCDKFARGRSGLCAAHGSMVARRNLHAGLIHELAPSSTTATSSIDDEYTCSTTNTMAGLIPPQVLVPIPMRFQLPEGSSWAASMSSGHRGNYTVAIPEGRVHGGPLLSLLGGDIRNAIVD